ncbi:MAG: copper homeostasis protein CutC [Chitinophagales bacterium]
MKPKIKIEICANSLQSAIHAQKADADRVELCGNLFEGGTTPSAATIQLARKHLTIDLFVLIRPRGGDFCYSDLEIELMLADIDFAKKAGANGVVLGVLQSDGKIDAARNQLLVEAAKPMQVTFHRAFDVCSQPFEALEQIIDLGFDRILTSGQQQTAIEGADLIRKLVEIAGERIHILVGSGVNSENIAALKEKTNAKEFHCSAKELVCSKMSFQNEKVNFGGKIEIPNNHYFESSIEKIIAFKNQL